MWSEKQWQRDDLLNVHDFDQVFEQIEKVDECPLGAWAVGLGLNA